MDDMNDQDKKELGKISKFLSKLLGSIIAILIISLILMLLWNALLPEIFGLKEITYLQALGIKLLCSSMFVNSGK